MTLPLKLNEPDDNMDIDISALTYHIMKGQYNIFKFYWNDQVGRNIMSYTILMEKCNFTMA